MKQTFKGHFSGLLAGFLALALGGLISVGVTGCGGTTAPVAAKATATATAYTPYIPPATVFPGNTSPITGAATTLCTTTTYTPCICQSTGLTVTSGTLCVGAGTGAAGGSGGSYVPPPFTGSGGSAGGGSGFLSGLLGGLLGGLFGGGGSTTSSPYGASYPTGGGMSGYPGGAYPTGATGAYPSSGGYGAGTVQDCSLGGYSQCMCSPTRTVVNSPSMCGTSGMGGGTVQDCSYAPAYTQCSCRPQGNMIVNSPSMCR